MHIVYWWENQKVGGHWEDHDNIKMDLKDIDGMIWIGLIWLRIGTSGGLL
jgi:hypothetical protein